MVVRYSSRPLPERAYIPGLSPRADKPELVPPRTGYPDGELSLDEGFRYGLDLFNHGFPWEAHVEWELLWFAAPRDRPERLLVHVLIHAAAAAIKARSGPMSAAQGFIDSACEQLALVDVTFLDTVGLARDLRAWREDPAQPPPPIMLRE